MKTRAAIVHVIPLKVYIAVGGALLLLTLVTVSVAQYDLGSFNLLVALAIAALKASLVALYFMHLKYDNKLFGLIFMVAIAFLAIFIVFTLFDTLKRDDIYSIKSEPIRQFAAIYDNNGNPVPLSERSFEVSQGSTGEAGETDEVPFEMLHGYGPIKEEVTVGPLDSALAMTGRAIFESKCATCHKLDERYTGPPLRNVALYRSPTFIMNQILDPAENVANHPNMQAMFREYFTMMTNQNVTREDARSLVEYLRWEAEHPPGS